MKKVGWEDVELWKRGTFCTRLSREKGFRRMTRIKNKKNELNTNPEPAKPSETNDEEAMINYQDLLAMDSVKPEVTLSVNGKLITFLCDSGACRTTCKELIPNSRHDGQQIVVRSASGKLTEVPESEPVWLRDPEGLSCKMSVLLFPQCPVNLLGRDGRLRLGLALIPSAEGQIVVKRKAELLKGDMCSPRNWRTAILLFPRHSRQATTKYDHCPTK